MGITLGEKKNRRNESDRLRLVSVVVQRAEMASMHGHSSFDVLLFWKFAVIMGRHGMMAMIG